MSYFSGDWKEDLLVLESFLETIEYKTSTDRLKAYGIKRSEGGSVTLGFTNRGKMSETKCREFCPIKKKYKTKLMSERPELLEMLEQFRDMWFPCYQFDSAQLNRNYKIPPHRDKGNIGDSVIVCCGEFTGGELVVNVDDDNISFRPDKQPVVFNGSKHTHWVKDFEGLRYSVVFFKSRFWKPDTD